MNLPKEFIQTIESVFDEDGKQFIKDLPKLVEDASSRWDLKDIKLVSNLSFNFVAYACRGEACLTPTQNVILKIGVLREELISEINALKLYGGDGGC